MLLCTPCGGCRQRLAEFGRPDTPVHLADATGLRETTTLGALLPMAFGPINLGGAAPAPADAAAVIRGAAAEPPLVALVLGSGLGGIAERIADATVLDYRDLPGFPRPGVQGHAGRLHLGRLGGVPVACLQGRAHLYEGNGTAALNVIVRTLKAVGCKALHPHQRRRARCAPISGRARSCWSRTTSTCRAPTRWSAPTTRRSARASST